MGGALKLCQVLKLDTGEMIIYSAVLGLMLLFVWLLFRIARYRSRSREIDERASEISRLSSPKPLKKARHALDRKVMEAPKAGLMVIMHKDGDSPARDMFVKAISEGRKGILVSTEDPREAPIEGTVGMIWLNRSKPRGGRKDMVVVNPTNLSGVLDEITTSMGGVPTIVLLDRFEDVIAANDIQRVIRFLGMLRDVTARERATFLVPVGYRAVPQRVRNQIMEAFETVVV